MSDYVKSSKLIFSNSEEVFKTEHWQKVQTKKKHLQPEHVAVG